MPHANDRNGRNRPHAEGQADPARLIVTGHDTRIEGRLEIDDSIQIECRVGGSLKVGGRMVIGRSGNVRADVETGDAVIHGRYEGDLVATGSVEITPTGRVTGTIRTNSLIIAEGAVVNGRVTRPLDRDDETSDVSDPQGAKRLEKVGAV